MGQNDNQGQGQNQNQSQSQDPHDLGITADIDAPDDAYLLLKVPDFGNTTYVNATTAVQEGIDPTGVSTTVLQSFLRLGAFDYDSEPPAAKELLAVIPRANAAHEPGLNDPQTDLLPNESNFPSGIIFVDDVRKHAQDKGLTTADDPHHGLTQTERLSESARLYSRGGWRDHSDGNRISTTWGDKVEVVRGNYKMIVMGRQNDPENAMGWEASGAHIQDYAPGTMPGASYWLEWIDDGRYYAPTFDETTGALVADEVSQKGVWLLVNTTENVYEYARNAGNFREEQWGDVIETYVGSENPPDGAFATDDSHGTEGHAPPHRITGRNYDLPGGQSARSSPPWNQDNKGMVRSNPHIIEKTWAVRIDSWTGSSNERVGEIYEETWAGKTDEVVNVSGNVDSSTTVGGQVTENSNITGAVTSTTQIGGAQTETTTVGGAITSATTAAAITDATTAVATMVGSTAAGALIFENTATPLLFSGTEAALIVEWTVAGLKLELEESALHFGIEHHLIMDLGFNMAPFKLDIALGRGYELGMELNDKKIKASDTYLQKKRTALNDDKKVLKGAINALSLGLGI